MARNGQQEEAQRGLRQIDSTPTVYDGARLEPAVRFLVQFARPALGKSPEGAMERHRRTHEREQLTMNFCKDCKHCLPGFTFMKGPYGPLMIRHADDNRCLHPKVTERDGRYAATGKAPFCVLERMSELGQCGRTGHLWEEKPATPAAATQADVVSTNQIRCE